MVWREWIEERKSELKQVIEETEDEMLKQYALGKLAMLEEVETHFRTFLEEIDRKLDSIIEILNEYKLTSGDGN